MNLNVLAKIFVYSIYIKLIYILYVMFYRVVENMMHNVQFVNRDLEEVNKYIYIWKISFIWERKDKSYMWNNLYDKLDNKKEEKNMNKLKCNKLWRDRDKKNYIVHNFT